MELSEALREENRRLRRLRIVVDLKRVADLEQRAHAGGRETTAVIVPVPAVATQTLGMKRGMALGLSIYFLYGYRNSVLHKQHNRLP